MSATIAEQQGLQVAIQKALKAEQAAKNIAMGLDPDAPITRICWSITFRIGKKVKTIECNSVESTIKAVNEVLKRVPTMPYTIVEHTEVTLAD